MPIRPTIAEIDLDALDANLSTIRAHLGPGVAVCAMVKADAYGHCAAIVAPALDWAGAEFLGVNLVEEGLALRAQGVRTRILVLGAWYSDAHGEVVAHDLTPVISDLADLSEFARISAPARVRVHVKFDTGMGRLGFPCESVRTVVRAVATLGNIDVEGVLSHLAGGSVATREQSARFARVLDELQSAGIHPRLVHIANSEAAIESRDLHYTMVRPGLALYGIAPAMARPSASGASAATFRPVMRVHTEIAHLKLLPTGSRVSYGGLFTATRPTRIGVLPVGYADGFSRRLSARGSVVIRGLRAPVVGAICMDMTMVDVTEIPDAAPGDRATLLGDGITAVELAALQETIPYEVLTGFSARVPRVPVRRGEVNERL